MQQASLDIINSSDIIILTFESCISFPEKKKKEWSMRFLVGLNFKFLYLFIVDMLISHCRYQLSHT